MNYERKTVQMHSGSTVSYIVSKGNLAKTPILFLHGWGGSAESFTAQLLPALEQESNDHPPLYALDFPGFGQSPEPAAAWTVQEYADCVVEFTQALNLQKVHVVCHSFGGRITPLLLTQYPERFVSAVCIAPAGVYHENATAQRMARLSKIAGRFDTMPAVSFLMRVVRSFVRKLVGANDYAATSGVMQETFKHVVASDVTPVLSRITQPVTLFFGRNDTYVPVSDAQVWHDAIPQSTLTIFEDGRHGLQYTHAAQIAHAISTLV
ncbi:MAG: alpha/beta hydrolase [Candidatus Kerfeldbacteria bacterium]|nr:alpha/beta hydrolase [Candidatus Kerfeldbacteria bacterium]